MVCIVWDFYFENRSIDGIVRRNSVSKSKNTAKCFDFLYNNCFSCCCLAAPRLQALRNREQAGPKAVGAAIRAYALELAQDKTTTFAQNIDNFIACTCESKEDRPQVKQNQNIVILINHCYCVGCDAQHEAIHVWYEELFSETWRERF